MFVHFFGLRECLTDHCQAKILNPQPKTAPSGGLKTRWKPWRRTAFFLSLDNLEHGCLPLSFLDTTFCVVPSSSSNVKQPHPTNFKTPEKPLSTEIPEQSQWFAPGFGGFLGLKPNPRFRSDALPPGEALWRWRGARLQKVRRRHSRAHASGAAGGGGRPRIHKVRRSWASGQCLLPAKTPAWIAGGDLFFLSHALYPNQQ